MDIRLAATLTGCLLLATVAVAGCAGEEAGETIVTGEAPTPETTSASLAGSAARSGPGTHWRMWPPLHPDDLSPSSPDTVVVVARVTQLLETIRELSVKPVGTPPFPPDNPKYDAWVQASQEEPKPSASAYFLYSVEVLKTIAGPVPGSGGLVTIRQAGLADKLYIDEDGHGFSFSITDKAPLQPGATYLLFLVPDSKSGTLVNEPFGRLLIDETGSLIPVDPGALSFPSLANLAKLTLEEAETAILAYIAEGPPSAIPPFAR